MRREQTEQEQGTKYRSFWFLKSNCFPMSDLKNECSEKLKISAFSKSLLLAIILVVEVCFLGKGNLQNT